MEMLPPSPSAEELRPAEINTEPPLPESDAPATRDRLPATPPVADPVAMTRPPEFPLYDWPV